MQEVSMLTQDKKVELLLNTKNPVIVDHLEKATIHAIHHTLDDLLETLFDFSKQAATIRASSIPESELPTPLSMEEVNNLPFADVVELIAKTNLRPENVDLIRKKNFGVLYDYDFRTALYRAAREVVSYKAEQDRTPTAPTSDVAPAKNKGGRPRKNPVAVAV